MLRMRREVRLAVMAALLSVLSVGSAFAAAGGTSEEKGPGIPKKTEETVQETAEEELQTRLNRLEDAGGADSYIVAAGNGSGSADVTVAFYTKSEDGRWKEEFTVSGLYGRNGTTDGKKEGDKKTPLGTYRFTKAFGILDDPGSRLPYHKLANEDYWVDDPASRYYNQMVNTDQVKKDWNSAEHLIAVNPHYNYCLALNYNEDCVPGKGSAIFLHCMKDETDIGTSGCVKIPEEFMKLLVQTVTDKTRIVIVSDIRELP